MKLTNTPFIMLDDKDCAVPLYRQIYEAVRRSILSGEFNRGMRVPATRQLAKKLGVSRMTIVNAYDQLLAEGYIEGRTGAGTYVASTLPEVMLRVEEVHSSHRQGPVKSRTILSHDAANGSHQPALRRSACKLTVITMRSRMGCQLLMNFPSGCGRKSRRADFGIRRESCSATATLPAIRRCVLD